MTTNVTIKNNGPGNVVVRAYDPNGSTDEARHTRLLSPNEETVLSVYKEQRLVVDEDDLPF